MDGQTRGSTRGNTRGPRGPKNERKLVQKIKTEAKFSNRAKVLFKGMQGARAVVLCTGGRQRNILDTIGDEEGLHRSEDYYSEIMIIVQIFQYRSPPESDEALLSKSHRMIALISYYVNSRLLICMFLSLVISSFVAKSLSMPCSQ